MPFARLMAVITRQRLQPLRQTAGCCRRHQDGRRNPVRQRAKHSGTAGASGLTVPEGIVFQVRAQGALAVTVANIAETRRVGVRTKCRRRVVEQIVKKLVSVEDGDIGLAQLFGSGGDIDGLQGVVGGDKLLGQGRNGCPILVEVLPVAWNTVVAEVRSSLKGTGAGRMSVLRTTNDRSARRRLTCS